MKKLLSALIVLFFSSNVNASSWGSGDFKLTNEGVEWFIYYIKTPGGKKYPSAKGMKLSFTEDGEKGWYYFCDGNPSKCIPLSISELNKECERKYKKPCKGFALGNRVKWLNGTNPGGKNAVFKRSDSIDEIKDKLIKLGFYE